MKEVERYCLFSFQRSVTNKGQTLLWVGILLLFTCIIGCSEPQPEEKMLVTSVGEVQQKFVIENTGTENVSFTLNLNNQIYQNYDDIVQQIDQMPEAVEGEPLERKTWRYVINHISNISPVSYEPWSHDPLIMLNSLGFGHCDDLATVLCALWREQGFESRVWLLDGHVVAEVFADDKWQMYDPSFAIYYLNEEGKVAGVDELENSPELISGSAEHVDISPQRHFIHNARRYSQDLATLYGTSEDNDVLDWDENFASGADFELGLPASVRMEFPVRSEDKIFMSNKLGGFSLSHFIKYTIPKNWQGTINVPFVVSQIKGSGIVKLDGEEYQIQGEELNKTLRGFAHYYNQLEFSTENEVTEVYCHINPALFNLKGNDTLMIEGLGVSQLEISSAENESYAIINYTFPKGKEVSDIAWEYYNHYLEKQDALALPVFVVPDSLVSAQDMEESIRLMVLSLNRGSLSEKDRLEKVVTMLDRWEVAAPRLEEIKSTVDKNLSYYDDPAYFCMILAMLDSGMDML